MAGSLAHIVNDDGTFTMQSLDHMGDAHEALDECFKIIKHITGGKKETINAVLDELHFPTLECDMVSGGDEAI